MTTTELILRPEEAFAEDLSPILYLKLNLPDDGSVLVKPVKRSIDARGRNVIVRMVVEIYSREEAQSIAAFHLNYPDVRLAERVVVIGSGPAGLFAA